MRLLYKTGPMESLRKWFYKPKRDDRSLLAQFFFADDALNMIAAELDSFDGRKDPDRCATLVNQLRQAQDRVLNITSQIMDQLLGDERVARGFRVKFPEDVLADNLAGQLWFGAECLAAGSSIMNREEESAAMRPLAKALTRSLETVRFLLRERCLRPRGLALSQQITADDMLHESLKIFDRLFAEFELCYVSAMVNVKTPHEFEAQQLICVLFSESLRRALHQRLLTQEQVDSYDPALMFAVPRLAIVSGLLIFSNGPLSIDKPPEEMSDMFRPFRTLLHKIRSLLWTLDKRELIALERLLATNGDVNNLASIELPSVSEVIDDLAGPYPNIGEFVSQFYSDHSNNHDLVTQHSSSNELTITEGDYLPDNIQVMTPIFDGFRRLSEVTEESEPENDDVTEGDKSAEKPNKIFDKPDVGKSDRLSDNSTETFQDRSRKTSNTEGNDLSSLRNLSSNGLMMFDPLVINAVSASTSSDGNRQLPDHDLVTSLNEQVTEIADRLSAIASDVVIDQKHSYSISEPALVSADDSQPFPFSNEQLPCMPSTSHGYLIPNAINHEPVVMSSLSHNNSAVFNQDDETSESNNTLLTTELPMIIPENIDSEIVNTNINLSIANANLSSLLLTNEEYRESFVEQNIDDDNSSFHSAKNFDEVAVKDDDRVKFMLGYESEHEMLADSGVSTENTSLDRSPDAVNREMKNNNLEPKKGVLTNPADNTKGEKSTPAIKNSIDNVKSNCVKGNSQENQAGSSNLVQNRQQPEEKSQNKVPYVKNVTAAMREEARRVLADWGMPMPDSYQIVSIEDVIEELRKFGEKKKRFAGRNDAQSSSSSKRKAKKKKVKTSPNLLLFEQKLVEFGYQDPDLMRLEQDPDYNDDDDDDIDYDDIIMKENAAPNRQAQAETSARNKARGKFKSSEDLIHRLFVCIAGVADQLQTNFAPDLRNILKSVFLMNQTPDDPLPEPVEKKLAVIEYEATEDQVIQNGSSFDSVYSAEEVYADSNSDSAPSESGSRLARRNTVNSTTMEEQAAASDSPTAVRRKSIDAPVNLQASVSAGDLTMDREENGTAVERAPEWVPDISAPACMRCTAHFTAFRRRHHCRNCGKVFCATCSANSLPLPRYGQMKPVRVCEECFRSIATNCRRSSQR